MKKKIKFVVSAEFWPQSNSWTGCGIEMGKQGTHDNYNVVYNGVCQGKHFKTERGAKNAARKARIIQKPKP